jgi:hypothetical protein
MDKGAVKELLPAREQTKAVVTKLRALLPGGLPNPRIDDVFHLIGEDVMCILLHRRLLGRRLG